MDLLLLTLLKKVLRRSVSWKRLGLGAVLGGIWGCLEVLALSLRIPGSLFAILSLLGACAMVLGAFGWTGWREFVKETGTLFILAVMAGGAMELVLGYIMAGAYGLMVFLGEGRYGLPLLAWGFFAAGIVFFVQGLWQFGEEARRERRNLYALTLIDGAVKVRVTGYLDTGNCLYEPKEGRPVHIVSDNLWRKLKCSEADVVSIPFRTIGNPLGMMEAARVDEMEVWEENGRKRIFREPLIARAPFKITRDGGYDVLLHKETDMQT